MSEYSDAQEKMFSKEPSAHTETETKDVENYLDKVEKSYHTARKKDWWNQYKLNYRNRHKDQVVDRKSELD